MAGAAQILTWVKQVVFIQIWIYIGLWSSSKKGGVCIELAIMVAFLSTSLEPNFVIMSSFCQWDKRVLFL